MHTPDLHAGLMSGTSLDGVDAVLARWPEPGTETSSATGRPRPVEVAFVHGPMPVALRAELMALQADGAREMHRAALAANALADLYAQTLRRLLEAAGVAPAAVRSVGAHGQTVRHRPGEFDGTGYTVQLLNGALLAERGGVDVVCDLRSRDLAAGGQGAPLVPAFHAEVFGRADAATAVLNLGGIANLTLLPPAGQGPVRGFDCGPANVLMDLWAERHGRGRHDADGAWAAGGRVHAALLQRLLGEPFLQRRPPKSTGRDLFHAAWLDGHLDALPAPPAAQDVMATLAEFTAEAACAALAREAPATTRLLVCGGGAFNGHLMRRLAALAGRPHAPGAHGGPGVTVQRTDAEGIAPDHVEALAFAWLARAFDRRVAGNLPAVTGAAGPRVLGALYPA